MSEHETREITVTDDDIREIVEQAEAGVGDLVAVYEQIEQRYFAAVSAATVPQPSVEYATHT